MQCDDFLPPVLNLAATMNLNTTTPNPVVVPVQYPAFEQHSEVIAKGVTLVVCPGQEIGWQHFCDTSPKFSIALQWDCAREATI